MEKDNSDLWNQQIKPMLAHKSEPFSSKEWLNEIKYDGTRCIGFIDKTKKSVRLVNRRLKYITYRYPELQDLWKSIDAKRVIIDGEIVVLEEGKPSFHLLQEREHVESEFRIKLLAKEIPVTYFVFDILYLNGEDLTSKPLIKRKKILEKVIKESPNLAISDYIIGKGKEFFEKAAKEGYEGIMSKKLDSPYLIDKRSDLWLKIKATESLDCVIVGYSSGTGKREEFFGSLIVGCYEKGRLRYVGKVGTGFDEKDLERILKKLKPLETEKCPFSKKPDLKLPPERKAVWIKPKLVCEVKFMELTEDKMLRAPVFKRLRTDKPVKECKLLV